MSASRISSQEPDSSCHDHAKSSDPVERHSPAINPSEAMAAHVGGKNYTDHGADVPHCKQHAESSAALLCGVVVGY